MLLDSDSQVFLMESHDEAYKIWRQCEVNERILIHIDAHHDLGWAPDDTLVDITNFASQALKKDVVREIFWVVPDQMWEGRTSLESLLRVMQKVVKSYPDPQPMQVAGSQKLSTMLLNKPWWVCSFDSLPRFTDPVLLDIDVDYFVIPNAYNKEYSPAALPWCWPATLISRLESRGLRADLVTIAYSVEGGFTPLKWKYLGDELALRLRQSVDGEALRGMDLIREAALAVHRGDLPFAQGKCSEAMGLLPASAAPPFHLALLYHKMGQTGPAQEQYQKALTLDPSYGTAYASAGFACYQYRRFSEAEQEHRRTLALNPEDAYAHLGMGQLAAHRKSWEEAERWLVKSLELDHQLVDAKRLLGEVLAKQGRHPEAIAAYEGYLKLCRAGHRPLTGAIISDSGGERLLDQDYSYLHAALARLYASQGEVRKAITCYYFSIAGGYDGVLARLHLAYLFLKQRQWQQAFQESRQGVKLIPREVRKFGRRSGPARVQALIRSSWAQ